MAPLHSNTPPCRRAVHHAAAVPRPALPPLMAPLHSNTPPPQTCCPPRCSCRTTSTATTWCNTWSPRGPTPPGAYRTWSRRVLERRARTRGAGAHAPAEPHLTCSSSRSRRPALTPAHPPTTLAAPPPPLPRLGREAIVAKVAPQVGGACGERGPRRARPCTCRAAGSEGVPPAAAARPGRLARAPMPHAPPHPPRYRGTAGHVPGPAQVREQRGGGLPQARPPRAPRRHRGVSAAGGAGQAAGLAWPGRARWAALCACASVPRHGCPARLE